jgi:serine/threonine-protein kinase
MLFQEHKIVNVICTRAYNPSQDGESWPHENEVSDHLLNNNSNLYSEQNLQVCSTCGMPLIIKNRYVPIDILGKGGFGVTYLALDLDFIDKQGNPRKRALKRFKHESFLDPNVLQQAQNMAQIEANILDEIKDPGIPRVFAPCTFEAPSDIRLPSSQHNGSEFYLPQEYIQGKDLDKLQTARLKQEKTEFFSTSEVRRILVYVLDILKNIHAKNIIHRDIKPSNIVFSESDDRFYLIDFGVVKIIDEIEPQQQYTRFGGDGFKAPEQLLGNEPSAPCTDLYSLGLTCKSLLTGCKNPNKFQESPYLARWQEVVKADAKLASTLNKMVQPKKEDRYQSADKIIKILFPPKYPRWVLWTIGGLGLLAVVATTFHIPRLICNFQGDCKQPEIIPSEDLPKYFTAGEESLVDDRGDDTNQNSACLAAYSHKDEGMRKFSEGNYSLASTYFEEAIKSFEQNRAGRPVYADDVSKQLASEESNPTQGGKPCASYDVEAQIFFENSKALAAGNPITVAISIPATDPNQKGVAIEMLAGAALAQAQFNAQGGANGRLLQLILVNDENKEDTARQTAELINNNNIPGKDSIEIAGVIGYLTSRSTAAASQVLPQKIVISPTSTAVRDSDSGESKFLLPESVFRTSTTDGIAGKDLANYVKEKQFSKVLVVYNDDPYSKSLSGEFTKGLPPSIEIFQCDVTRDKPGGKAIGDCTDIGNNNNVDAVMIALGTNDLSDAAAIINNRGTLESGSPRPVMGGDALYSGKFLGSDFRFAIDNIKGLVIAVPWHWELLKDNNGDFSKNLKDILGTTSISWRTATTYDAMIAIIEALKKTQNNSDPKKLIDILKDEDPATTVTGATGNIDFDPMGDRVEFTGLGVLVEVDVEEVNSDGSQKPSIRLLKPVPER